MLLVRLFTSRRVVDLMRVAAQLCRVATLSA